MRNKIKTFEEEVGKTYHYLTLIAEAEPIIRKNSPLRRWVFKCVCGKEVILEPGNVLKRKGSVKSCGCKRMELIKSSIHTWYNGIRPYPVEDRLFSIYKVGARRAGREFPLTKELFRELVNSNCYYCGTPPYLIRTNGTTSVKKPLNGIDRVDSSKGYLLDNIVPCCWHCNKAKMNRSLKEFKEWIKLVYNNLYSQV